MRLSAVALSASLALLAAASSRSASVPTAIRQYVPFVDGVLARAIHVSTTAKGYCWTSSIADARADAFRCFVGANSIADPCFSPGPGHTSRFVVCPLTPASSVLRLELTKPLPANRGAPDPERYQPWAIELADGRWCTAITGAVPMVAGHAAPYMCVGGVLLEPLHRGAATWTMGYATGFSARSFRTVALRAVWW
jgi:hypothetical protein